MNATRSETRTEHGWHSFDRVAGLVSLGLVSLLLVISLARGSFGGGTPEATPPLRSDQATATSPAAPPGGSDNPATSAPSGAAQSTGAPPPVAGLPSPAGSEAPAAGANGVPTRPESVGAGTARAGGSSSAQAPAPRADTGAPASASPPGNLYDRIPTGPPQTLAGAADTGARAAGGGLVRPILDIRVSDDRLTIDGIIGDENARKAIVQAALQKFGMRNISDRLAVSAGVARFDWSGQPEDIIALVGEPGQATSVKVDGSTITLSGVLPDLVAKESKALAAQQLFGPAARISNRIQLDAAGAPTAQTEQGLPAAAATPAPPGSTASPPAPERAAAPPAPSTASDATAAAPQAEPAPQGGAMAPEPSGDDAAAAQAESSEAGEPPEDGSVVLTAEVPTGSIPSDCARIATGITIPFRSGSAELTPDGQAALQAVAPCLERREYIVGGHTDGRGSEVGNQVLSEKRAQAVVAFLVAQGVPADRLTARGYGESRPVDTNRTEAGRARNRRIDFRFDK